MEELARLLEGRRISIGAVLYMCRLGGCNCMPGFGGSLCVSGLARLRGRGRSGLEDLTGDSISFAEVNESSEAESSLSSVARLSPVSFNSSFAAT